MAATTNCRSPTRSSLLCAILSHPKRSSCSSNLSASTSSLSTSSVPTPWFVVGPTSSLHLPDTTPHAREAKDKAHAMMIDCSNNIAQVYLQANDYETAKQVASQVLSHDPHNFSALLCMGKACLMEGFGSLEEAEIALASAVETAKSDRDRQEAEDLQAQLVLKRQEHKKKAKAMFRRMRKSLVSRGA